MTEFAVTNLVTCVWQSCRSCINLNTAGKGLQSKLTFLNFLLFLISCSCVKPCNSIWIPSMIASWLTCHFGHSRCKPCAQQYIDLCNIVQTFFFVFFLFLWTKIFFLLAIFLILVFQMIYHKLQLRVKSDSMW